MPRQSTLLHSLFSRYLIPIILASLTYSMRLIADKVIVGNFLGERALAVLHLCLPIGFFFDCLFALFAFGAAAIISTCKGERDHRQADEVFTLAFGALLVTGLLMTALGLAFNQPLASLFAGDSGLMEMSRTYLYWRMWSAGPYIFIMGLSLLIGADNRPKLSSAVVMVFSLVTIAAEILLIGGLGLGIAGAGLCQLIGGLAAVALTGFYLFSRSRTLHLVGSIAGSRAKLIRIIRSGGAITMAYGLALVNLLVLNTLLMKIAGPAGLAVFSVCLACVQIVDIFNRGGGQTIMPLVGLLYGERDFTGIRMVMRLAYTVILSFASLAALVLLVFPAGLAAAFGVTDPMAVPALRCYAPYLVLYSGVYIYNYYLTTVGRARLAAVVTLADGLIVILPLAFGLSAIFGVAGFWLTFVVNKVLICLGLILFTVFYLNRRSSAGRHGLLSLPDPPRDIEYFEATARRIEEVVGLSERVLAFCLAAGCEKKEAYCVGLAVEEMGVNSMRHSQGRARGQIRNCVDIMVSLRPGEILVSFRDDQNPFDPTQYRPEERGRYEIDSIAFLCKIASRISYERNLGLNCTLITVRRGASEAGRELADQEDPGL